MPSTSAVIPSPRIGAKLVEGAHVDVSRPPDATARNLTRLQRSHPPPSDTPMLLQR